MAIWQFQFRFIPREFSLTSGLLPGSRFDSGHFTTNDWWTNSVIPTALEQQLGLVLPLGSSWTEGLKVYGDLESTCVTILYEAGIVREVTARLDLRTLSPLQYDAILHFARDLSCLLATDDNLVLTPERTLIGDAIRTSSAYRFVKDPKSFLERL